MSASGPDRVPSSNAPSPVPTEPREPRPAATRHTVDVRALAPLAAWTRATRGEPLLQEVCAEAGLASESFSNGGGQVPPARLETWLSALRDRIGGDGALLAAGMASETPPADPPRWLRWIATPTVLYRGRVGRRWVTAGAGRLVVRRGGIGGALVRYTSAEPQSRVMCLWRQTRLAQRTRTWGLPPAIVRETRCLTRGDDACEYVVNWQARPRWTGSIAAMVATIAWVVWSSAPPVLASTLPTIVAGLAQALETERVRRANRTTREAFGVAFRRATSLMPARPVAGDAEPVPAPPSATSPATGADQACASLSREGDFWRVTYESKTVLIRHSRGLSLLVHLLRNPGEEIHVSALDAVSPSDIAAPVACSAPVDAPVGDLGDAGEVLDAQAKATYRRRIGELREEIAEAETNNDIGRVERLRVELEALTDQLRQATGLGGRDRRAASNADRVRVAVTRRIRAAITQIEKHHPPLGEHLAATIHTGYFCSYGPGGVAWDG